MPSHHASGLPPSTAGTLTFVMTQNEQATLLLALDFGSVPCRWSFEAALCVTQLPVTVPQHSNGTQPHSHWLLPHPIFLFALFDDLHGCLVKFVHFPSPISWDTSSTAAVATGHIHLLQSSQHFKQSPTDYAGHTYCINEWKESLLEIKWQSIFPMYEYLPHIPSFVKIAPSSFLWSSLSLTQEKNESLLCS